MSTHLTLKIICSRNEVKKLFYLTDFPAKVLLFGVRKNICTGPLLDIQELHSWITLKANVCIFLYIFLYIFVHVCIFSVKESFSSKDEILSSGMRGEGGRIISLGVLPVWGTCTSFLIFHLNWNFLETQLVFSISVLPSIAIKCWNFPDRTSSAKLWFNSS